jgi:sec-independent protein translocase protein TatB
MRQYDASMSFSETIFLFFVALLIFGPKKLPEIGRQVGKILNDFKRASNEFKAQIEAEISKADLETRRQNQSKSWQDKPKNTVMLPSAPPEGTVSADSKVVTVTPAESLVSDDASRLTSQVTSQETVFAKESDIEKETGAEKDSVMAKAPDA